MADLIVVDLLDLKDGSVPEGAPHAAGVAQHQFACPADQWWYIDSIMVRSNSAATSTLLIFVGGPGVTTALGAQVPVDEDLIDGTSTGDLDVSDRASPIRVFPGNYLTFRWEGLTVGSIAKLHLQGRVLKRRR